MSGSWILTTRGERLFFSGIRSNKYTAIFRLAFLTGLPKTRLVRLTWGEVHFEHSQIVSLAPTPKTYSLPPEAKELLLEIRPQPAKSDTLVFPRRDGGTLSPNTIRVKLGVVRGRVGLGRALTFPTLYQTFLIRKERSTKEAAPDDNSQELFERVPEKPRGQAPSSDN